MSDSPSLATFTPHVGQTFRLTVDPGTRIDVELVRAKPLDDGRQPFQNRPGQRQAFALVFRGPETPRLAQRIYRFEREALAEDIFIVPIGLDGGRLLYEAIFT